MGCRPRSGWNWAWRILREHEGIVSGCEVNRLIAGLYGERLPSIDLLHVDPSRGEQRPEQLAAVSADGSTVCVLILRLNSSCTRSIALVVRHWLGGRRVKVNKRSPASSKLSAT